MRKPLLLGVVFFCGASLWAMLNFPSPATENGGCCQQAKKGEKRGDYVCPIYLYEDHSPDYCLYYAFICPNTPTSMSGKCGLGSNSCQPPSSPPSPPCEEVGTYEKNKNANNYVKSAKKPMFVISPKGRVGLDTKPNKDQALGKIVDKNAQIVGNSPIVDLVVQTKPAERTCKIRLYLVHISPPNPTHPPHFFGRGSEIEDNTPAAFSLPHKAIVDVIGKTALVEVGSVTYQVIFHKNTVIDLPE